LKYREQRRRFFASRKVKNRKRQLSFLIEDELKTQVVKFFKATLGRMIRANGEKKRWKKKRKKKKEEIYWRSKNTKTEVKK